MNIINFLQYELSNTKNNVKMLQASLLTLKDCVNNLEFSNKKEDLFDEIENLEMFNDNILESIDKIIIKSNIFLD